jgi:hypothetical protein
MSDFDLDVMHIVEVLLFKYKAKRIEIYGSRIEAETAPTLGEEFCLIELVVQDNDVSFTDIQVASVDVAGGYGFTFRNVTASYQTNPQVVEYKTRLKRDIGWT